MLRESAPPGKGGRILRLSDLPGPGLPHGGNGGGGLIVPGRSERPVDNGMAVVVDSSGRAVSASLTGLGWMRLSVLLIKKYCVGAITVSQNDIVGMPDHFVHQRYDFSLGLLDIIVQAKEGESGEQEVKNDEQGDQT